MRKQIILRTWQQHKEPVSIYTLAIIPHKGGGEKGYWKHIHAQINNQRTITSFTYNYTIYYIMKNYLTETKL